MGMPQDRIDAKLGKLVGGCEMPTCIRFNAEVRLCHDERGQRFICLPCYRKAEGEERATAYTKRWQPLRRVTA